MDINLIRYAPIFAGLSDEEQNILSRGFESGQLPNGQALFRAGEQSEALYLLNKGFAKLTTDTGINLATLGTGSVLGEASSFRNAIQDVTAIASSDIEYWRLSDQRLREIVLQNPAIGIKLGKNFGSMLAQMQDYLVVRLSDADELQGLPRHTLQAVASRLEAVEIDKGKALMQRGETANGLFLLENGSMLLLDEESDGHNGQTILSGSILGALALLTDKPQINDVVALEDSMLWMLSVEDFQALNSEHRALRRTLGQNVQSRLSKLDRQDAVTRLEGMPIFAELPPASLDAIAQRMILQHISAGERVYRVGDGGDALYLIESGEIELTAENASGVIEELARIGSQGFFGEMSLFTGQIRTEDATATRNTNLWVLLKSDLDSLSVQDNAIRTAVNKGLASRLAADSSHAEGNFRNFELLADLGAEELQQVVQHLKPTRYRQREQIVRISAPSEALYLIENGEVRVQTFNGGSWLLGPGESFGEQSLLTNQPHNASISAHTDVDLWTLSKVDFDTLLTQYPGLAISLSRILSQRLAESNNTPASSSASSATVSQESAPPAFGFGQSTEPQVAMRAEAPQASPFAQNQGQFQQGGFQPEGFQEVQFPSQEFPEGQFPPQQTTPLSARQRRANAAQHMAPQRERMGFGQWFSSLSGFAKLRFALIVLLLIWLFGIALPFMFLSMIQGTGLASGAALPVSVSSSLSAVYSIGSYEVAMHDRDSAMQIALRDRLVSPTPTYTPFPTPTPISTPTPAAQIAAQQIPNNSVDESASDSGLPKFIRSFVNVAEQAQLLQAAPPSAPSAAEPAPEEKPQIAAPSRAIDPRIPQLGVRIEEANVASGQNYWRLMEVRFLNEKEAGGKHHIYVDVLNSGGSRVVGQPVSITWGDGAYTGNVEDKAFPDLGFNYQMYAAGYAYNVHVEGLPSDKLIGAGLGGIENRFYGIHVAYELIFQEMTKE
ncbi:MAG: cyclic nucleotide-binding domain-containing protein [Chloroflexota bacterium]